MDNTMTKVLLHLVQSELNLTGNKDFYKLTTGIDDSKLRSQIYSAKDDEPLTVTCVLENGSVNTITVSIRENYKTSQTKLMYLKLKDKHFMLKPSELTSIFLLMKHAVEMTVVGTVSPLEQEYVYGNLPDLKESFDIFYFTSEMEDMRLRQFEDNVEFIRLKAINKNISKLSVDTKIETLGDNNKPVSHFHEVQDIPNEDPRDVSLKWLSSTSHTQIAVKKDTLNELLAYESNFKHMGVPEIMDLVMKSYMGKGSNSTSAMRGIDSDFRKSDK